MTAATRQAEPKASWVSQAEYSSRSNRSVERVRYLDEILPTIRRKAEDYFRENPEGEQVTLACLGAIEESVLKDLSKQFQVSTRTVKQDLGILVPLVLIEMVGPEGLETYRHSESLKNSTRSCPKRWASRSWVSRYTPHRLTQFGRRRLSERGRPRVHWDSPKPRSMPKPIHLPDHLL